ncbi:MAG: outer membrane protein assembly factor BamA, partial [Bacteroidota bacterium]
MKLLLSFLTFLLFLSPVLAQQDSLDIPVYDYSSPQEYEIGGLRVEGAFFAEENAILGVTGLRVGDKIRVPGPDIPKAIRNLWRLRLFTNASIEKEKTIGNVIFLIVRVEERPRLLRYSYAGVKQGLHDDLNEEINRFLVRGGIVTENTKVNAAEAVRSYFVEKGFLDTKVSVEEIKDTARANSVRLLFTIERNEKVKIKEIN